jgi:hypothetical protein
LFCKPTRSSLPLPSAADHHHQTQSLPAGLLTEIINSRLFTTVRDTLGLTYDVSFELSLFDRLPSGAQLLLLCGWKRLLIHPHALMLCCVCIGTAAASLLALRKR